MAYLGNLEEAVRLGVKEAASGQVGVPQGRLLTEDPEPEEPPGGHLKGYLPGIPEAFEEPRLFLRALNSYALGETFFCSSLQELN